MSKTTIISEEKDVLSRPIQNVKITFEQEATSQNAWKTFFKLCLEFAEVIEQRAAEMPESMLSSDPSPKDLS